MDEDAPVGRAGGLSVVPVSARDTGALLALVRALAAEDGRPLAPGSEAAVRAVCGGEALARAWLLRPAGVPKGGGTALGYVVLTLGFSLEHGGRDGFIDELYVAPEARGHGHGLRLLRVAEDAARSLGVRTLHLEVERANADAQALYRRLGYRDNDRRLMSKPLGGAGEAA